MKFLKKLKEINKLYYTTSDLLAISDYEVNSLYVILNRLVKNSELIRLATGIYILPERYGEIERIANSIYFPSYLSFDTALAKYGVLSQLPYTLMFSTPLKTKSIQLGEYRIEYRSIRRTLFWGYTINKEGLYIATPEKALFDMYYLSSYGKIDFDFQSIDKNRVDMEVVDSLRERYLSTSRSRSSEPANVKR